MSKNVPMADFPVNFVKFLHPMFYSLLQLWTKRASSLVAIRPLSGFWRKNVILRHGVYRPYRGQDTARPRLELPYRPRSCITYILSWAKLSTSQYRASHQPGHTAHYTPNTQVRWILSVGILNSENWAYRMKLSVLIQDCRIKAAKIL